MRFKRRGNYTNEGIRVYKRRFTERRTGGMERS
jgi:hypothetical protein